MTRVNTKPIFIALTSLLVHLLAPNCPDLYILLHGISLTRDLSLVLGNKFPAAFPSLVEGAAFMKYYFSFPHFSFTPFGDGFRPCFHPNSASRHSNPEHDQSSGTKFAKGLDT